MQPGIRPPGLRDLRGLRADRDPCLAKRSQQPLRGGKTFIRLPDIGLHQGGAHETVGPRQTPAQLPVGLEVERPGKLDQDAHGSRNGTAPGTNIPRGEVCSRGTDRIDCLVIKDDDEFQGSRGKDAGFQRFCVWVIQHGAAHHIGRRSDFARGRQRRD